jgi:5-dehydro-2-deoxygluconokinase
MLAVDHRWQWEEWCDGAAVARARIPDIKHLAADAFLAARAADGRIGAHGALLIDTLYASQQVTRLMSAGAMVGTPAEWPGSSPVRWQTDPMSDALTGRFVKVLVRHRPETPDAVVGSEVDRLLELQAWCRAHGQPLVLEVVVPRGQEPEAEFETTGRAPIVAAYIGRAYAAGLMPDFWKIEGTTDAHAAALVDRAIAAQARSRFLVLGKGAAIDQVARWFATARTMATATGFAIGRTVYFEPVSKWLRGELTREQASDRIVATYRALIDLWEQTPGRG